MVVALIEVVHIGLAIRRGDADHFVNGLTEENFGKIHWETKKCYSTLRRERCTNEARAELQIRSSVVSRWLEKMTELESPNLLQARREFGPLHARLDEAAGWRRKELDLVSDNCVRFLPHSRPCTTADRHSRARTSAVRTPRFKKIVRRVGVGRRRLDVMGYKWGTMMLTNGASDHHES